MPEPQAAGFILNRAQLATSRARELALAIAEAALASAAPERLVASHLQAHHGVLKVGRTRVQLQGGVWVLGAGKAAWPMAAAVEQTLGADRVAGGAVIAHAPGSTRPHRVQALLGNHPVPDDASVAATARLLAILDAIPPGATVLWLLSGGASALLCAPAPGLTLTDKQETTRALLRSGATIDELNTVRKHLSAVKGGQVARRLAGRRVFTLAVSDIVSGRLDMIGSGPTLPDRSTYAEALTVLARYHLNGALPPAVVRHLQLGSAGGLPETPKPGDPCFTGHSFTLLASPATAAEAAAGAARAAGIRRVTVLTAELAGEAVHAARFLGQVLRHQAASARGPRVVVAAGETTVTVRGSGKGGRNQELAAALIHEVAGLPGCAVACLATDGQDFVPGAGGALIDGETAHRAAAGGVDVAAFLANNDAYALHRALGTLIESRSTGTNVCDLVVAVLGAA